MDKRGAMSLDDAIYAAQTGHNHRQDRAEAIPIKRRGRRVKRQPSTAIISRYAQWAIEDRESEAEHAHKQNNMLS